MLRLKFGGTRIEISFLFTLFLALICFSARSGEVLVCLAAVALHEAAHLAAMRLCGVRVRKISAVGFGFVIDSELESSGRKQKIACMLAGCAANLATACLCFALGCREFAAANTVIAAINLIPAAPLDGGRALAVILDAALPQKGSRRTQLGLTAASGLFVLVVGIYVCIELTFNPFIPTFGLYLLYSLREI